MRRLAGPLAVLLALCLAGGCTASRNVLGTGNSACFQAIPVAEAAVQHRGEFVGVLRVQTEYLKRRLPGLVHPLREDVCVVAYRGNYQPGQVRDAPPDRHGRYAVIVVSSPGNRLVRSFVLDELPLRFRHL